LIKLRREHPIFRRRGWFTGSVPKGKGVKDLEWFRPDGVEMTAADWGVGYAKTLGAFLNGGVIAERDHAGAQITDDSFFVIFNSYNEAMEFRLPSRNFARGWTIVVDTTNATQQDGARSYAFETEVHVSGRALIVLRRRI
jgi:glycogen operon protein